MRLAFFRHERLPKLRLLGLFYIVLFLSCGAPRQIIQEEKPPETATGLRSTSLVRAKRHMVVAANPLAAAAGQEVLRQGGSAIDAAIAVQAVLGLVEPQSSGLGGGALLLFYQADTGTIRAFDGRETAPANIRPDVFVNSNGAAKAFYDAALGGTAVGVPGAVRMLDMVHKRFGKRPWSALFAGAIQHAEQGFPVSLRLHTLLKRDKYLRENPVAARYFYRSDGSPVPVGERLVNKPYAETITAIAAGGAEAFYQGALAKDIVAAVRNTPHNPGLLTEADLASYQAKEREPVCIVYRTNRVCSFGPPSSGGVTVLETLGILSYFELTKHNDESIHLLMEASRLAFADRDRYLADSDFVSVPTAGLLAPGYLQKRASLIQKERAMGVAMPGQPEGAAELALASEVPIERPSTSHMVIVDDFGNVVSMTTSIEDAFGSRIMVHGFLLNNQMTDFSLLPTVDGKPVANRVQPGKRPRSSMTPIIAQDAQGQFLLAMGSAGGARIIGYVLRSLVAVIDWNVDIATAVSLPQILNRNADTEIESDRAVGDLPDRLRQRGERVRLTELNSGIHGLVRRSAANEGYEGGADPRREGVALGD